MPTANQTSTPSPFGSYSDVPVKVSTFGTQDAAPGMPLIEAANATGSTYFNGVDHPSQRLTRTSDDDFFVDVRAVHILDDEGELTGKVEYATVTMAGNGVTINNHETLADAMNDYADVLDDMYGAHTRQERIDQHVDKAADLHAAYDDHAAADGDIAHRKPFDLDAAVETATAKVDRDTEYYAQVVARARAIN